MSFCVAPWISCILMDAGMSVVISVALTLGFMLVISSSLFST